MSDAEKQPRPLRPGEVVRLSPKQSGRRAVRAVVERVEPELIHVAAADEQHEIEEGDSVSILRSIRGDARYEAIVEIRHGDPRHMELHLIGEWERIQERNFVRVSTYGIKLKVTTPAQAESNMSRLARRKRKKDPPPPPQIIDISAGGLRFETAEDYKAGQALKLEFTLPGETPLSLSGKVIRASELHGRPYHNQQVAVEFSSINEPTRVHIMTWVFAEQARRFREDRVEEESEEG